MYDPFDNLLEVKQDELPKGYDPFRNLEQVLPTKEFERPFAPKSESLTAKVLDFIPFAKYLLPEEQDKLELLSSEERNSALAWEAVGAALFVLGGPLLRGAGKAAGAVAKRTIPFVSKPTMTERFAEYAKQPIEDIMAGVDRSLRRTALKPFNYEEALRKKLAGSGFAPEEVEAVTAYKLTGNRAALRDAPIERQFAGKPMTKRWVESIEATREPYGGFKLKPELEVELDISTLTSKHLAKQYGLIMAQEVFGMRRKDLPKQLFESTFNKQMVAKYGKEMTLDNITERDFAEFALDMLKHPAEYRKAVSTTAGRWWPASLTPTRIIYGLNEEQWGTYTGIYKPLRSAFERAREYTFNRLYTWTQMLKERGLVDIEFTKYGDFKFKNVAFKPIDQDHAYQILRYADDISRSKELAPDEIKGKISAFIDQLKPSNQALKLVDAWRDFSDTLYGEFLIHKIPANLRALGGLNQFGQNSVDALTAKMTPRILGLFSTSGSKPMTDKMVELKSILDEIKEALKPTKIGDTFTHSWFDLKDKELVDTLKKLEKTLTLRNDGGELIGYVDNYVARVSGEQERSFAKWSQALTGRRGFFELPRKSEQMAGEPVDFATMIYSRIHSQANALHLFPTIDKVVENAKGLPINLANYVEHHIARLLNIPSSVDHKLAGLLENTVGSVERMFGKEGRWTPRRVMETAQTIVDLTYLGGLGFKPFSAMRNLFQPLVTVPADLGGLKDYATLARGYASLAKPEVRKYLQDIGIITEYAPEISLRPAALPFQKTVNFAGRVYSTEKLESIKDAAMWMFRASDRFNRYVTGAAALNKWETALSKVGGNLDRSAITWLMKDLGLNRRNPWVKHEIEDLIRRNQLDKAKATFIRDVVADTQFLYSSLDSPLVIGKGGSIGKTGLVFQSYWMNLFPLLEKFARTGTADERTKRAITWLTAQAAAYTMMAPVWGKRAATESIGFGPFPTTVSEYMIPAPWQPIYRSLAAIGSALQLDPEKSSEQIKRLMKSSMIFVPGGLQMAKSFKGYVEEGFPGFAKSIIGFPLESQRKD